MYSKSKYLMVPASQEWQNNHKNQKHIKEFNIGWDPNVD